MAQDPDAVLPPHRYTRLKCFGCGHFIDIPVYCGDRFCPICSKPRMFRIRRRLNLLVRSVELTRGQTFKHLVLTMVNRSDPRAMIDDLITSFRRLRNTKLWRKHVAGGAYVIEVTVAQDGRFHAHIHCVCQADFVPYENLLSSWRKASRGSTGCYIKTIPVKAVIHYLTKYLTKPIDAPDIETRERLGRVLGNYRLFQPFGSWHGIKTSLPDPPYKCPTCGLEGHWLLEQEHDGNPFYYSHEQLILKAGFR